eukprot:15482367-Alexandrium_andersonii.AAC.1
MASVRPPPALHRGVRAASMHCKLAERACTASLQNGICTHARICVVVVVTCRGPPSPIVSTSSDSQSKCRPSVELSGCPFFRLRAGSESGDERTAQSQGRTDDFHVPLAMLGKSLVCASHGQALVIT